MADTETKPEEKKIDPQPEQARPGGTANYDFFTAQEAQATGETYAPSDEELKRRKQRSLAIAGGIALFMVLVFLITVVKIGTAAGS